jgi:hypothetical protein
LKRLAHNRSAITEEDIHVFVSHDSAPGATRAGDPVCTHTIHGLSEEELFANTKKHGLKNMVTPKKRGKKFQRI